MLFDLGGVPVAPTGVAATSGNAQVGLNWNASATATSYKVKRATTSGGPYTTITNVTGTACLDLALNNGTTYYYVVSAINISGEGVNSPQVSAIPSSTVPVNVSMSASAGALTLSWPTDHIGWRLQTQTNIAETNWVTIPSADMTNVFSIPTTNDRAYFRLIYP